MNVLYMLVEDIKYDSKLFNNTLIFNQIFWRNPSPSSADGSWILTDPFLELCVGGMLNMGWGEGGELSKIYD